MIKNNFSLGIDDKHHLLPMKLLGVLRLACHFPIFTCKKPGEKNFNNILHRNLYLSRKKCETFPFLWQIFGWGGKNGEVSLWFQ
jgi:hypothetical protein